MTEPEVDRFLRPREVCRLLGIGKTKLYALVRAGTFPKPVSLGWRTSVWLASEVASWQRRRVAEARGEPPQAAG